MTPNKRLPLTLALLVTIFPILNETLFSPTLPLIAEGLSVPSTQLNWINFAFYFGLFAGTYFWHRMMPTFGQFFCLVTGFLLYGPGSILGMTAHCGLAVVGARLLQGFGLSVGLWLVPILTAERKGVSMENLLEIASLIALVLTPLLGFFLGGYIAEAFGFRANFLILACMSFVIAYRIYTHFAPENFIGKENLMELLDRSKVIFKDRIVFYSMVMVGLQSSLFFGYCSIAPVILFEKLSFSPSQFGIIGFFIVIPSVLGGFVSMQYLKDITKKKFLRLGTLLIFVGSVMTQGVLLLPVATTSFGGAIYWMIASTIIWFGLGIIFLPTLKLSVGPLRDHIPHRMPILGIMTWGITMLGSLLISLIAYIGVELYPVYFLIISCLIIVAQFRLLNNVQIVHASKTQ